MKIALLTTDNRENDRRYDLPGPVFGTAPEALLQGLAQWPEVEVHVLSCVQSAVRVPERIAPNIWFHALHVPKIGWLRTGYQGCIRAVRRKLRVLRPQIVHGQGTERDCALGAVFSSLPNVVTVHGNMRLIAQVNRAPIFSYQWLAAKLESFAVPRSDGVVCISHYTQMAVRAGARRTWVVPNAVDHAFFQLARAPEATPLILCVGHIQRRKNQIALIRALDPLVERRGFRLFFAGSLSDEPEYVAEFKSLVAARSWCEYGGAVGREELRHWFVRATALALPSLEDNCPMTVLEAMAAGVPVLAARVGGVPELVEHGVTGLLCEPTVEESLREGVERLLADSNERERLAQSARRRAEAVFRPAAIAGRHLEIYREVIRGRS